MSQTYIKYTVGSCGKKGMQVVVWRGLYFVQFRIVKPVDLCGFITATPGSTVTSMLLLVLAFCTLWHSQQLYCVPKAVNYQEQLNQCCVPNVALCIWLSLF